MSDESRSVLFVARTRDLLRRLIRAAGLNCREIDRRIGKNRGFIAYLLRRRAGLPLAELLATLDVVGVRLELAELYLTHQRFDRALLVLEDVREVFEAIGVRREAHAALLLAKEAVAGGCATAEVVRQVAKSMAAAEAARG